MLREIVEKQKKAHIVFDIFLDNTSQFMSSSDNAADLVDRKLKTKRFKGKNFRVLRTINGKEEDVTKLFK